MTVFGLEGGTICKDGVVIDDVQILRMKSRIFLGCLFREKLSKRPKLDGLSFQSISYEDNSFF